MSTLLSPRCNSCRCISGHPCPVGRSSQMRAHHHRCQDLNQSINQSIEQSVLWISQSVINQSINHSISGSSDKREIDWSHFASIINLQKPQLKTNAIIPLIHPPEKSPAPSHALWPFRCSPPRIATISPCVRMAGPGLPGIRSPMSLFRDQW